jgi:hypothetical protein
MMIRATTTAILTLGLLVAASGGRAATPFSNPPEIVSGGGIPAGTLTVAPATV